jgi:hypothetical protein
MGAFWFLHEAAVLPFVLFEKTSQAFRSRAWNWQRAPFVNLSFTDSRGLWHTKAR